MTIEEKRWTEKDIDGILDKLPRIANMLHIDNKPGLATVLMDAASIIRQLRQKRAELRKKQKERMERILRARSNIFILYQDHLRTHLGPSDQRTIRDSLRIIYENANPKLEAAETAKEGEP